MSGLNATSDHDLLALHERLGPQEAAQARHEARRPALPTAHAAVSNHAHADVARTVLGQTASEPTAAHPRSATFRTRNLRTLKKG
eukprot:1279139-Rhodomonas_salina.2